MTPKEPELRQWSRRPNFAQKLDELYIILVPPTVFLLFKTRLQLLRQDAGTQPTLDSHSP